MKRLIKSDIIKEEGKQVGILYHFTDLISLIKILNSDSLGRNSFNYVSLTRNKNFNTVKREISGNANCLIIIDGDNLSNSYKVEPFHDENYFKDEDFGTEKMESEERIKGIISPIINYILNINLLSNRIDKLDIEDVKEFIERKHIDLIINDIYDIKKYIEEVYGINVNIE